MSNEELTQRALALPLAVRVELAQALWESTEGPDAGATDEDREAIPLARARDSALATGRVEGRTHEQVMESARRPLG